MAYVPAAALPQGSSRLIAVVAALMLLYVVGLDNGLLLSVAQGDLAFDQNIIHELVHDARHTAAFPCH
jgi:hypothetical protein